MIAIKNQLILKGLAVSTVSLALIACGNGSSTTTSTTSALTSSDLSGSYVFKVSGTDSTDGDYAIAGTFTANGSGVITGGIADYNLGSGIDSNVPLTGTYTVSNGIATLNLTETTGITESYFFPVIKTGTAALTRYDGTGSGTVYAPVTSSAPAGAYTVSLSGEGDNTVTATANFTAGTTGTFSGGTESYTDGANLMNYSSVSGFLYPKLSNGRGVAAIGGNNFSYYMATANQVVLLGLDDRALLSGTATKQ